MEGRDLRIVYMGTPDFAAEPLRRLVEGGYQVVAVVTMPDKPSGRGLKLKGSAVKEYAQSVNLPLLQPEKLRDPQFLEELRSYEPDLGIVVAFKILPEVVWSMPRCGTFNLHASLLPDYRGAAPINWAIMNGDKATGVTTFMLDKDIDTGDLLFRESLAIAADESAGTLHDKLMFLGADLVLKSVDRIASGAVTPLPQGEICDEEMRPAPKIFKEDCKLNWNNDIVSIYNKVRGLSPYPAAWFEMGADSFKLFSSHYECNDSVEIGKFSTDGSTYLKIGCRGGYLYIDDLQMAGKKRMNIRDFLRGHKELFNQE